MRRTPKDHRYISQAHTLIIPSLTSAVRYPKFDCQISLLWFLDFLTSIFRFAYFDFQNSLLWLSYFSTLIFIFPYFEFILFRLLGKDEIRMWTWRLDVIFLSVIFITFINLKLLAYAMFGRWGDHWSGYSLDTRVWERYWVHSVQVLHSAQLSPMIITQRSFYDIGRGATNIRLFMVTLHHLLTWTNGRHRIAIYIDLLPKGSKSSVKSDVALPKTDHKEWCLLTLKLK